MFTEDELVPLSALQHLLFCERQCALIHVEQLWADNRLTVEGNHLHRKVDAGPDESRGDLRIVRALQLRSLRLGLVGKADAVEFRRPADPGGEQAVRPVEYKRGRPKRDRSDEVQLCAQALCLEEMLGVTISAGAIFYGTTRRRVDIAFEQELREHTENSISRLHQLLSDRITPRAVREPKCESCSLLHLCLPEVLQPGRSARRYLEQSLREVRAPAESFRTDPRRS